VSRAIADAVWCNRSSVSRPQDTMRPRSSAGDGVPMRRVMSGVLRRLSWLAVATAVVAVWSADWVATATVPEMWTVTSSGYERVEVPFSPAFPSADWWLLMAPRLALPVLVVATLWSAVRNRRLARGCALAAVALLTVVLLYVAANEALALRAGVFAAQAAVAAAVAAALAARARQGR
jgi:hypothetical protein